MYISYCGILLPLIGPIVLHASRWLKQQYLTHDSWQQWREVPNLMQFDQRLGELTIPTSEQLKNMDYSNCYYDLQDEFPSSVIPVSVKSLVNACTSSDHPWLSESCILNKGAPGQGKSFLLSKLCQYWALGYGMRSTTLMFWVHCSQFQNRIITLSELLSQLLPIETQEISNWIINKQGKGVVFVLDGYHQQRDGDHQQRGGDHKQRDRYHQQWDAYHQQWDGYHQQWDEFHQQWDGDVFYDLWTRHGVFLDRSGGVLHKLVSRKFLPKSVVLIASTYTPNRRKVKQLQLLNLTENQTSKQVVRFFVRPSKVEAFYLYLNNNLDMRLLASTPVHLYTLLFVCNKLLDTPSHEFPVTWTELFTNMTLFLLQSTFQKLPQIKTPPGSVSELPSTVQLFLRELSTLAFENLSAESFHLTSPAARCLGHGSGFALVHPYSKPLCHNEKQCFRFSSPLLQQFVAALHVHNLPLAKQTELMMHKSELNFLWQFFAGLLISESYDRFRKLKNAFHKKKMKVLANCAYEADWLCDMPSVFRDHTLTPADMHHACHNWF